MRLVEWGTEGTSEGLLWFHLWVTMEASLLGFFSVYTKAINSVPRVVLTPIFMTLIERTGWRNGGLRHGKNCIKLPCWANYEMI